MDKICREIIKGKNIFIIAKTKEKQKIINIY